MKAPTTRQSILKMVRDALPWLSYVYPRTYVVRATHADGSLDLDPPPDASDLAPLNNVPQWCAGLVLMTPAVGTSVLVWFRDARRERAVVVAFAPAAPGAAVARQGDAVVRIAQDSATGALYVAANPAPDVAHTYAAVATHTGLPPGTFAGTTVAIGSGSEDVTCS